MMCLGIRGDHTPISGIQDAFFHESCLPWDKQFPLIGRLEPSCTSVPSEALTQNKLRGPCYQFLSESSSESLHFLKILNLEISPFSAKTSGSLLNGSQQNFSGLNQANVCFDPVFFM